MYDRGTEAVVAASAFTALAGVFIFLRVISRFFILRAPGGEDYLILGSVGLSIGFTVTIYYQNENGLGQPADTVSPEENIRMLKGFYVSILIYNTGLYLMKCSILYQYLRFFVQRGYRRAAWGLIIFTTVGGTGFILAFIFACSPVAKFWDYTVKGKCVPIKPLWFSSAGFQLATDLATFVLPIRVLYSLQLPKPQKFSLIFVFAIGGFGCLVSVLRLYGLYLTTESKDMSYGNVSAATWSAVELNVSIMCACFPAIRPVVSLIFPKLSSSSSQGQSNIFSGHAQNQRRPKAYYQRNISEVELSRTARPDRAHSEEGSLDNEVSSGNGLGVISVKHEWTVQTRQVDGPILPDQTI